MAAGMRFSSGGLLAPFWHHFSCLQKWLYACPHKSLNTLYVLQLNFFVEHTVHFFFACMEGYHPKHITSHHIISYHITSYRITLHHIPSHDDTPHHGTSPHITSHPITSPHITTHLITSHHTTSHHITSNHSTSNQVTSHHIPSHSNPNRQSDNSGACYHSRSNQTPPVSMTLRRLVDLIQSGLVGECDRLRWIGCRTGFGFLCFLSGSSVVVTELEHIASIHVSAHGLLCRVMYTFRGSTWGGRSWRTSPPLEYHDSYNAHWLWLP